MQLRFTQPIQESCTNEKQTELYIECEESHRNIAKEVERIEKSTELRERWSDMSLASTLRSDGRNSLKEAQRNETGIAVADQHRGGGGGKDAV